MSERADSREQLLAARATLTLAVTSVTLTIMRWNGADLDALALQPGAWPQEPWRLVTAVFLHGNFLHLAFNLYWLMRLGPPIEARVGTLRMSGLYLLLAALPSAAEWALFRGGIGLSGVGYGLFGYLWVMGRLRPEALGVLDRQIVQFFVGWFFLCIVLDAMNVLPIANVAHAAGGAFGALAAWAAAAPRERRARRWLALSGSALFVAALALARPVVNLSPSHGQELAREGYEALEAGELDRARRALEAATRRSPRLSGAWHNLGVVHARQGRAREARAAYERALKIAPENPGTWFNLGLLSLVEGDREQALRHFHTALRHDPGHADARAAASRLQGE